MWDPSRINPVHWWARIWYGNLARRIFSPAPSKLQDADVEAAESASTTFARPEISETRTTWRIAIRYLLFGIRSGWQSRRSKRESQGSPKTLLKIPIQGKGGPTTLTGLFQAGHTTRPGPLAKLFYRLRMRDTAPQAQHLLRNWLPSALPAPGAVRSTPALLGYCLEIAGRAPLLRRSRRQSKGRPGPAGVFPLRSWALLG